MQGGKWGEMGGLRPYPLPCTNRTKKGKAPTQSGRG